jgi:hypothetical protein
MNVPRALAVLVLLRVALAPASAGAAAPSPAQAAFDLGVADLEAGHLDRACPAIESSYKLDPRPGTLFTLAECEAQRGRVATAVKRYDDYLAIWSALAPDKQHKQGDRGRTARVQRATLLPLVPELSLQLPPDAPPGTVVLRDGAVVAAAALGVSLPIDPGEHVISTQAPGQPAFENHVLVAKGERKSVLLEVRAASAARSADPAAGAPAWQRPAGIVGGAAAAVLLGVGIGFGVRAVSLGADARAACGGHVCAPGSPGVQLFEDANSAADVADGTLLTGALLAVGGAALLILAARDAPAAARTERARFEVVPAAGPGFAAITARGAW